MEYPSRGLPPSKKDIAMRFFRRHWPTILAIGSNLPAIWRGLVWIFDWEVRIETFVAQLREVGNWTVMISLLLNPPPWIIWVTLPIGLLLIWWDVHRRRRTPDKTSVSDEVQTFYNSWLYPAAENINQVLQRVMHAIRKHPDYAVQTNGAIIQRIMDEERAALSGVNNALRGIENVDNLGLQNRIGAYYSAYQGCRTWIIEGFKLTSLDLSKDSIFQEWQRLDTDFLRELRRFSGPPQHERLRHLIGEVGWGENISVTYALFC
jgi:hypothetical protein